jgi:hypothetical protein
MYSILFYSILFYECAGLTVKIPVIKPAQRRKYNTKILQIHKNKTLKKTKKHGRKKIQINY